MYKFLQRVTITQWDERDAREPNLISIVSLKTL